MTQQASKADGLVTVKPKGDLLIKLRNKVPGRTQKEVEEEAGIPSPRLGLYEHSNPISYDHLYKLALYYNRPARELVDPSSIESAETKLKFRCKLLEIYCNGN